MSYPSSVGTADPLASSSRVSVDYTRPSAEDTSTLINRVKTAQDSDAFTTLANSHTGLYLKVVSKYAATYPNVIRRDDLADDRLFNLYRFILDYDPSRGTKLSTYIGDRTDWMCRTLLKQNERNPVRAGTYGPSGAMSLGSVGDTYTTAQGESITLADEAEDVSVVDVADRDLRLQDVIATAWRVCKDARFISILQYRHLHEGDPTGQTSLSWRQIGQRIGISHEMARRIYWTNLALVKAHIKDRAA